MRRVLIKDMVSRMTATLILDEAGRLVLPVEAVQALEMQPGEEVKVEVTRHGIALYRDVDEDVPEVTELTPDGLIKVPERVGPIADAVIVAAIKAGRDERDRRILRR